MDTDALSGGFADAPVQAAHAFRAAMTAMAQPGRIRQVAGAAPPAPLSAAAGTLVLALCDADTPVHLTGVHDTPMLRDWITFHTGAPLCAAGACSFAIGVWDALRPLDRFACGTSDYPDRGATLIVETDRLEPAGATLQGPGIARQAALSLPETDVFRRNAARFPLGLDFFFTCGDRLAALPRSTKVTS
ncbi:phosphonate C-P lyase system protein PhnH [Meridianimarinicoccus roseus]|uniref:Phosphonate C-P lyase system protein PhnH n=1 Tax=Meridianimarinicoccus roseus TaxID=2072018 RepID=A0A2V2LFP0_9RHOB|nr:phosphonate C-P lyase system protein PhnH [Meridianimarinicoccus roseus]PWR04458.1 phosphonate C-P lyase system protein PhnH [Meridianimarinicoccus roseus]